MSKVTTVKIGSGVAVPTITTENLADSKVWSLATGADALAGKVSNEIRLRSYFLLGSVVDMGISKAVDLVTATACDKGLLSKGRTVAEFYVNQVIGDRDLVATPKTASDYAEGLELCLSEFDSLYGAYTAIKGEKSPKELTVAELMAKAVKRALEDGYSIDQFVALAGKVFHEKSEMGEI